MVEGQRSWRVSWNPNAERDRGSNDLVNIQRFEGAHHSTADIQYFGHPWGL
jgi:hypothetical protein